MGSRALDPAVFGGSADAVYAVTADGTVTLWNRAAEELFGYAAHEMLGRSCWTAVRGCDTDGRAFCLPDCEVRKKARLGEAPERFALMSRAKDGRPLQLDIAIITARTGGSRDGTLVHIVRDDSAVYVERERRQSLEHALRRANRALRVSRDGYEAIARASDERQLLDEVCRLLVDVGGYRLAWVAMRHDGGRGVRPVAHAGLAADGLTALATSWGRHRGATAQALDLGQPFVARDVTSDPTLAPWRAEALRIGYASLCALPLVRGPVAVGILNVCATEPDAFASDELQPLAELARGLAWGLDSVEQRAARRAAEQATAESERQYRLLAENVSDVIWIRDMNLKLTYVSPSVERQTGYTTTEATGLRIGDLLTEPSLDALFTALQDLVRDEGRAEESPVRTVELALRGKLGTTVWTENTMSVLRDADGMPIGVLGVSRDISDRHRAQTEKAELEELLRQAQKMEAVGRLAGGIAHDFNNLLTVIVGRCALLAGRTSLDDRAQRDVDQILKTAQRAVVLTRQLLAFSRKQILQPRVVDPNGVVNGLEPMLRRLVGEDIDLRLALAPDARRIFVDAGQLEQVVLNLVVNARDAMPTGGRLTIETANVDMPEGAAGTREAIAPGRYVRMIVSDTGVGMGGDVQSKIFEPFFTTKAVGQGTGLGLSTVLGIINQSGGYVSVSSEPGRGASFSIYLPQTDAPVETPRSVAPAPRLTGSETVLIVEDDVEVRRIAGEALEEFGYRVLEAADSRTAINMIGAVDAIDLLITDVVMPRTTGPEVARELTARRPGLRVLYMSGYTESEIARRTIIAPGATFIEKPFTPAALAAKVREALAAPAE